MKAVKGLCLASRVDSRADYLRAFLRHHLPWCEKAVLLLGRRPGETVENVMEIARDFGPAVKVVDHCTEAFTFDSIIALSNAVKRNGCSAILHLDTDEFLSCPEKLEELTKKLRSKSIDCVEGRMVSRFGPAGRSYPSRLDTYEDYCRVAPVRCLYRDEGKVYGKKCFMARSPHVRIHEGAPGWRVHGQMLDLEHFKWTDDCVEKKMVTNPDNPQAMGRVKDFIDRTPAFFDGLERGFYPHSKGIHGWFNYQDVYRMFALKAPEGATVVEVGVWLGKSLTFLCEYTTLIGKHLNVIGYDKFDPDFYESTGCEAVKKGCDWYAYVRDLMQRTAPWNPPTVIQEDSVKAAERHADKSVFAVWIDAEHTEAAVTRDIKAWIPKIRPDGILAGHDLTRSWPGVAKALDKLKSDPSCNFDYVRLSDSSWMAVLP